MHLGTNGQGEPEARLSEWFGRLSELRRVRVCSGDWLRVCGPSVTFKHGVTLLAMLGMKRRTFEEQRARGGLPFLEERQPRIGHTPRYRADLVDQYFAGTFRRPMLSARVRPLRRKSA